jgi:sulfonate transport system ATP-binding protein
MASGLPAAGGDVSAGRRTALAVATRPPAEIAPLSSSTGSSIEIAAVARRFGDQEVLRDIALGVAPGEFVAIVGHSGCGKSTLLRLLAGLDATDGGTIRIDGQPVAGQLR